VTGRSELLAQAEGRILNLHNGTFQGLEIDGPVFRVKGQEFPINSVSAEVSVGAQTSKSRSTGTRIIGGGLVAGPGGMLLGGAAKKKTDTSKVYITVKVADGSVTTVSAPAAQEGALRRFSDSLESAVNRTWPIQTPFGTTLELHPDSKRVSRSDPTVGLIVAAIVGTFFLLLAIGAWALLVGVGLIAAIITYNIHMTNTFNQQLDEAFPGWRAKSETAKQAEVQRMWDNARNKEQGNN
jgi:hypothetical protein